ncbi:permease, partial [Gemmatimonadota bacterium]
MDWRGEWKPLSVLLTGFLLVYFLPLHLVPVVDGRLAGAGLEGVALAVDYAREHVLFCLIPAFFIAGAISVFVRGEPVIRLMGPRANRFVAYGVASVAGTVLAVCSCTVLPLFAGIYAVGAG